MSSLPLFFALLPFVLFVLLLFVKRMTLPKISLAIFAVALAVQVFYWKILPVYLLNSATKGFFVAFDIFLIVLGAVFFLEVLKEIGVIENIGFYLESISKDYRVQVILLAWFFINFMEGMAGFGTPGAIVAPILVSMGLSPVTAIVICLLGNSSAGAFGAVGTPIRVGLAGLDTSGVPWYTVIFNSVGFLVPAFIAWFLAREQKDRKKCFLEILPFALWSGFVYVASSMVTVNFGQEFVSVVGSLLAIVVVNISLRWGWFVPKNIRVLKNNGRTRMSLPLWKVLLPYWVIFVLLVLGKSILRPVMLSFPWGYQYSWNLFNPGIIFLIVGIPFALFWGRKGVLIHSWRVALSRTIDPFVVILAMSSMVQMMVNSGNNTTGLPSVLSLMARGLKENILPIATPFIGAFGCFLSGSVTISNILFSNILASASVLYKVSTTKILALETAGAAMGNMTALADIMAAEATVGMKNKTREVLKGVLLPCLVCLSILGVLGLLIIS